MRALHARVRVIAIALAALICAPVSEGARKDVRMKALEIPNGAEVLIKTKDGQSIEARLEAVTEEGVTVSSGKSGQVVERSFPFAAMKSIHELNKPMSPGKQTAIAFGFIYLLLMALSAAFGG